MNGTEIMGGEYWSYCRKKVWAMIKIVGGWSEGREKHPHWWGKGKGTKKSGFGTSAS